MVHREVIKDAFLRSVSLVEMLSIEDIRQLYLELSTGYTCNQVHGLENDRLTLEEQVRMSYLAFLAKIIDDRVELEGK